MLKYQRQLTAAQPAKPPQKKDSKVESGAGEEDMAGSRVSKSNSVVWILP